MAPSRDNSSGTFRRLALGLLFGLVLLGAVWPAMYRVLPAFGVNLTRPGAGLSLDFWLTAVAVPAAVLIWLAVRTRSRPIVLADIRWAVAIGLGLALTVYTYWGLLELRQELRLPARQAAVVATGTPAEPNAAASPLPADANPTAAYLLSVLLDNGWFQPATVWLFWIAVIGLLSKVRRLDRERQGDREVLLALPKWKDKTDDKTGKGGTFGVNDAPDLRKDIRTLKRPLRETTLVRRVDSMLERVELTKSSAGVDELMNDLSAMDAEASSSSYGGVHFLIYAMPAIGFLGTIYGVGRAIYGFSLIIPRAQDFVSISPELTRITHQLGVAFDTTLLALVLSALTVLAMTIVRRSEDTLLGEVDNACVDLVLRRLKIEDPGTQAIVDAVEKLGHSRFRENLQEHIDKLQTQVKALTDALGGVAQKLAPFAAQVETCTTNLGSASTRLETASKKVEEAATGMAEQRQTLKDQTGEFVKSLGKTAEEVGKKLKEKTEELVKGLDETVGKVQASVEGHTATAREVAESLRQAVKLLNAVGRTVQRMDGALEQLRHLEGIERSLTAVCDGVVRFSLEPLPGPDGRPSDARGTGTLNVAARQRRWSWRRLLGRG